MANCPKSAQVSSTEASSVAGAAPPARRRDCLEPEVDEGRRGRALAVLSRRIASSDPAQMIEAGPFPRGDITEAAYRVALLWMKGGYREKAEILIETYGLRGERVEELARATSGPAERKD